MPKTTRQGIAEFHQAFGIQVENLLLENPSIELRVLRAKLLLEECVEIITQGLGLKVYVNAYPPSVMTEVYKDQPNEIDVYDVGCDYDPIETFDGLGDVNVIIHGTAHCLGGNLDRVTSEIHRSNMTKLGEDGRPIINAAHCICKVNVPHVGGCESHDPTKPVGKILKSPNFEAPNLGPILSAGNWPDLPVVHIDESTITPSAALDHCVDHPDQTTQNCEGSFGLAGGGMGPYYVCGKCGNVFGKVDIDEDF